VAEEVFQLAEKLVVVVFQFYKLIFFKIKENTSLIFLAITGDDYDSGQSLCRHNFLILDANLNWITF